MKRDAILEDIKWAFTDFLTQKDICQKKEMMKTLVDAFFNEVVAKCSDRQLSEKFNDPEKALQCFSDYLDKWSEKYPDQPD